MAVVSVVPVVDIVLVAEVSVVDIVPVVPVIEVSVVAVVALVLLLVVDDVSVATAPVSVALLLVSLLQPKANSVAAPRRRRAWKAFLIRYSVFGKLS